MATDCVGKTKAYRHPKPPSFCQAYTSVLSADHRPRFYTDRARLPKHSQDNRSKWQDTQKEDPSSRTSAAFCQLNYRWAHLIKPEQKQAIDNCDSWHTECNPSTLYACVYLPNSSSPSSIIYSSTFHRSHQLCAGLSRCHPSGQPFHLIQQDHFSGFHEGDSSIRRHSSSNYPLSLKSTSSLMPMKKCSKWLQ